MRLPDIRIELLSKHPQCLPVLQAWTPGSRHPGPWAGAGLVPPGFRRRGIDVMLLARLERLAGQLGYEQVCCATVTSSTLLARHGWRFIERIRHDGEDVEIFAKTLQMP